MFLLYDLLLNLLLGHFAAEPNLVDFRQVEFPRVTMAGIHGGGDRTGREAVADSNGAPGRNDSSRSRDRF